MMQHFAMSMGRCGVDFRAFLPPVFERVVKIQFERRLRAPVADFQRSLSSMALTPHALVTARIVYEPPDFETASAGVQVPLILTSHGTLAQLANGFLLALNELRECAPLAVAYDVAEMLQARLVETGTSLAKYYSTAVMGYDTVSKWVGPMRGIELLSIDDRLNDY